MGPALPAIPVPLVHEVSKTVTGFNLISKLDSGLDTRKGASLPHILALGAGLTVPKFRVSLNMVSVQSVSII